jgi:hypothetical protein
MKRIVPIMMLASCFLLMPRRIFADSVLTVSGPATVAQGSSFAVDVNISGAMDLFDFQLDLDFNPAVLAATSASEGPFLPGGGSTFFIPGTIDNIDGAVIFNADSLLSAISGATGDGTLLIFNFTALSPGTSPLTIENEILQDSLGNIIPDMTTAGSVTVAGASSVPEPSASLLLLVGVLAFVSLAATKARPSVEGHRPLIHSKQEGPI